MNDPSGHYGCNTTGGYLPCGQPAPVELTPREEKENTDLVVSFIPGLDTLHDFLTHSTMCGIGCQLTGVEDTGLDWQFAEIGIVVPVGGTLLRRMSEAGAGLLKWKKFNEIFNHPSVVKQPAGSVTCGPACGEMITNGRVTQEQLTHVITSARGSTPRGLANGLNGLSTGSTYEAVFASDLEKGLDYLTSSGPWIAEIRQDNIGHFVVVDGITDNGMILIRDPDTGSIYHVTRDAFLGYSDSNIGWNGNAVIQND